MTILEKSSNTYCDPVAYAQQLVSGKNIVN